MIEVVYLHGCDRCGNSELDRDECLCEPCKAKVRQRSAIEKRQIEQDCLILQKAFSEPISKSLDELPDDLELWTAEALKPHGTRITALIFTSNYSSSIYYGKNWVSAASCIHLPHPDSLQNVETWDDFAAALLRA